MNTLKAWFLVTLDFHSYSYEENRRHVKFKEFGTYDEVVPKISALVKEKCMAYIGHGYDSFTPDIMVLGVDGKENFELRHKIDKEIEKVSKRNPDITPMVGGGSRE